MAKTPTLADLAKAAGVSTYTASCAMRGLNGLVAKTTAERVLACAKRIGYVPNISAQVLSQQRRKQAPKNASDSITPVAWLEFGPNPAKAEVYGQMKALARSQGFDLRVVQVGQRKLSPQLSRELRWQGVRGLILNTAGITPEDEGRHRAQGFRWDWFSTIKITHGGSAYRFHTVCCNAFTEVNQALQMAHDAGYRRIGALFGGSASPVDDRMRLGSLLACEQLGNPGFEFIGHLRPQGWDLPPDFASWVESNRIELILGFPGFWLSILRQNPWRIPEDVAFVGLSVTPDGEPELYEMSCTMTSNLDIYLPEALGMLHQLLIRGETGLPTIVYERGIIPRWNPGKTMPRKSKRRTLKEPA